MSDEIQLHFLPGHTKKLVELGLVTEKNPTILVSEVMTKIKVNPEKYLLTVVDILTNELGNIGTVAMFLADSIKNVMNELSNVQNKSE